MKTADEILEENCDSLPAWTDNRKRAVVKAMKEYAKAVLDEVASWPGTWPSGHIYGDKFVNAEAIKSFKDELK